MPPSARIVSIRSRLSAYAISAETTSPSAAPFRAIAPMKWPNRFSSSAAGVPAAVVVPTLSPCATSRAVAVSNPDRRICQLSWSSTQPECMAWRGTSGMPVSIDRPGSVHGSERNSPVHGPLPSVIGSPKAALSRKPQASASSATTTSPSAVTASLTGASGSRPWPSSSEASSGCSASGR